MKSDSATPSVIALIPARSGSKRVPGKNVRVLAGLPLLAYTIHAAKASGIFQAIVVSTEDPVTARLAQDYGAQVPFLRPEAFATDLSPDIEWIRHALDELTRTGIDSDCFALLRPTSPFRRADTIRRAWQHFLNHRDADSLRAVERCTEHPGKMWVLDGLDRMHPLLPNDGVQPPSHSRPYQALPPVYVQNASLEIAWTRVPRELGSIAGDAIVPFVTEGYEGFDINAPLDWWLAEELVRRGEVALPTPSPDSSPTSSGKHHG